GSKSYVLCDEDGQILPAHSISAGLDYPGVGPEHAYLRDSGRAKYVSVTDDEAVAGLQLLARTEGILCALETAHAVAHVQQPAAEICTRRWRAFDRCGARATSRSCSSATTTPSFSSARSVWRGKPARPAPTVCWSSICRRRSPKSWTVRCGSTAWRACRCSRP